MKKTVTIIGPVQLETAISYLKEAGFDPVHEMILKPHKADRSAVQNRLLWLWNTEIGNQTGEGKEEVHERYKEKFLVHIFERDNEGFAEMLQAVRNVWKWGERDMANMMKREILKLTSTRDANVDQMREFLNSIELDATSNGLALTNPDELYKYAMKEK